MGTGLPHSWKQQSALMGPREVVGWGHSEGQSLGLSSKTHLPRESSGTEPSPVVMGCTKLA